MSYLQEQLETVLARCITSDPHHGPVWQEVLKDPKNAGQDLKFMLETAAERVEEMK